VAIDNQSTMDLQDPKKSSNDETANKPAAKAMDSKPIAKAPIVLDIWVPQKKRRRKQVEEAEVKYPVEPNVIHIVTKPRSHVNHTYRDFSNVPSTDGTIFEIPQDIGQMSFHLKVYHLLSLKQSTNVIEWCNHGRAIRIIDSERLEYKLHPYFGYNRMTKFRKSLSNHGFKSITQGRDAGCYYSEVWIVFFTF
jgi:HSF-type DNA-binding